MPSSRSFASFILNYGKIVDGDLCEGILFGGVNCNKLDDLWKFSFTETEKGGKTNIIKSFI